MTDYYTRLVSRILFPFQERFKGHSTVSVRKVLEKSQWWDAERVRELQLTKLRTLLRHSAEHVPYYRRMFREIDFDPRSVTSLSDLEKLPFLTKGLIRSSLEALKADDAKRLARFNTGGSSGEPLIFFIGKERVSHDVAAKWRATRWWGVDIGDPEMVVWGSPIEIGAQDWLRAVRDKVFRTQLLPAFEMSEAKLDGFIAAIRIHRPTILFGYPSALSHIACHAQNQGKNLAHLGIKVAFVTAERLYDDQRDAIARTFGCRVANGYGGRDAGFIAHQCPEGGMHITAEDVIVEIVDREGRVLPPGKAGEIVVTHLATREFPFIRYRTGDVAELDGRPCPCGRGLPLLKEIQGRTTDFVVATDGTVMHGLALIYVLRDLPGIESFKIIQESLSRVRVLIVQARGYSPAIQDIIQRGFRARLGERIQVDVECVEEIPPERSGKFRYVVSQVESKSKVKNPILDR